MVQSTRMINQLLEPTNRRLDALMMARPQAPSINVPVNVHPANVNITFPERPREHVLDQPDAPLVQPMPPAVSAGPKRLDDPHENLNPPVDYVDEQKQEASSSSSSSSSSPSNPGEIVLQHYRALYPTIESMNGITVAKAMSIMRDLRISLPKNPTDPMEPKRRTITNYKQLIFNKLLN